MNRPIKLLMTALALGWLPFHDGFTATPVDLSHHSVSYLQSMLTNLRTTDVTFRKVSHHTDFNHTSHIRMKQQYQGFPVWGGDFIIHQPQQNVTTSNLMMMDPNAHMNGQIYENLAADLGKERPKIDNDQKSNVLNHVTNIYQKSINKSVTISHNKINLIVYIDKKHKAHWAYHVEFFAKINHETPSEPIYILDAKTLEIYQSWNNLHTLEQNLEYVPAGGYGGNRKIGVYSFDGVTRDSPAFSLLRDKSLGVCYLQGSVTQLFDSDTSYFEVRNAEQFPDSPTTPVQFPCTGKSDEHRGIYWNGDPDFLADNSVFYHANVTENMYMAWYATPVFIGGLTQEGNVLPIRLNTHANSVSREDAFWTSLTNEAYFGDGDDDAILPLTSLDIVAHELSHAFTQQHASLTYMGQSGGINESFSDMAAVAASYYGHGSSTWKIGADVLQSKDALRFIDNPRQDCIGIKPWDAKGVRNCSIDHVKDYKEGNVPTFDEPYVDVHFSSGIFNKVFYLMAEGFGGDQQEGTRKAFNIMVQANSGYWVPNVNFTDAACGVMSATHDYGYDESVVENAFSTVGIDTKKCSI